MKEFQRKVEEIIKQTSKDLKTKTWLVGGYVRDILLNRKRQSIDVDIITRADPLLFCKNFVKRIPSIFFTLDKERRIFRIVLKESPIPCTIDVNPLKGSIKQDLSDRDFTINAVAQEVISGKFFDPFGGMDDLKEGIIKMVSQSTFRKDPVRILRAFRLACELDLKISCLTYDFLKKHKAMLSKCAPERLTDELFKILACKNSWGFIEKMLKDRILEEWLPVFKELHKDPLKKLLRHAVRTLSMMEKIFNKLDVYFGDIKNELNQFLDELLAATRTRRQLLKLTAILHDIGKPSTFKIIDGEVHFIEHEKKGARLLEKYLDKLPLSTKEKKILIKLIENHMRPGNLAKGRYVTERALFRYFKDLGGEGVSCAILSLADWKATYEGDFPLELMEFHRNTVRRIVTSFFKEREKVIPKPLLNGHQIMEILSIPPGPLVGTLLEKLKEAQASGEISNKEEAINFVKKCFSNLSGNS